MKRRKLLLLSALLLWSCFSWVRAEHQLVLNVAAHPPLYSDDANGFLQKLSTVLFHKLDLNAKLIRMPPERGLRDANLGRIDGDLFRVGGLTRIYPNLVQVREKLLDVEFVVFSAKMIDMEHGWQSLAGKSLAYIRGWKLLDKKVPASARVTKVKNAEQLFHLLAKGRVDLVIFERWGGVHFLQNFSLPKVKILAPPLAKRSMFIYLHRKHAALVPQLEQMLRQLKANGVYQQLKQQYLPLSEEHAYDRLD